MNNKYFLLLISFGFLSIGMHHIIEAATTTTTTRKLNYKADAMLLMACKTSNYQQAYQAVQSGANVNTHDNFGGTPLLFACWSKNIAIIQLLLVHGVIIPTDLEPSSIDLIQIALLEIDKIRMGYNKPTTTNTTTTTTTNESNLRANASLIEACKRNNLPAAELAITINGADVNTVNSDGKTPLEFACNNKNLDLIKMLLRKRAKITPNLNSLCLVWIQQAQNQMRSVPLQNQDATTATSTKKSSLAADAELIKACQCNDYKAVELAIKNNADLNCSTVTGKTPLIFACSNENTEMVKLLLKSGADANTSDVFGMGPLVVAAENKNREIVKLLLDYEAEIPEDLDLLNIKFIEQARSKIATNLKKNAIKSWMNQCSESIYDSEPTHDIDNKMPASQIQSRSSTTIKPKNHRADAELFKACKNDIFLDISRAIDDGADVNAKNEAGLTPLMVTCINGNLLAVKMLLTEGAEMQATDAQGKTALFFACEHGNDDIANLLYDKIAALNTKQTAPDFDIPAHPIETTTTIRTTTPSRGSPLWLQNKPK